MRAADRALAYDTPAQRYAGVPGCLRVCWSPPWRQRTASTSAQPVQGAAHELVLDSSGVPDVANWVVLDANGTAAWRAQGETSWRQFTRGEVLPPGAEIETGSDGEIMLVAGGDQLTIAPQGRLIVPLALSGQDRRLRHERGHILVQIESRACQGRAHRYAFAQPGHQRHDHRSRGRSTSRTASWCMRASWR